MVVTHLLNWFKKEIVIHFLVIHKVDVDRFIFNRQL